MPRVQDVMDRDQTDLSYDCHLQVQTYFSLLFDHPVSEGLMQCSSCHEHQHAPFIFEHPTGVPDSCQTCQNSHDSTNTKMLNRPVLQFPYLEYHSNTPSFHDLPKPSFKIAPSVIVRSTALI